MINIENEIKIDVINMDNKKKIVWVIDAWFVDCDFRIPFIKYLSQKYDITWIVLLRNINRYVKEDFEVLKEYIEVQFITFEKGERSLSSFSKYAQIRKIINKIHPDLVYLNIGATLFFIPTYYRLNKKKVIVTAHQGAIHEGMKNNYLTRLTRNLLYKRAVNVHLFSKSQVDLYKESYATPNIYLTHLGLKDFGEPTLKRKNKEGNLIFLAFGIINYAKHIDLLIDAACMLFEKGYRNFRVVIKGNCPNWDEYKARIKYPELFDIDIRVIENSEIPNLFTTSHYFIQPYRILSQSGPTKIAFRYNTPIIASNLPAFKEEIINNTNGYLFKTNDVEDLCAEMGKAIMQSEEEYDMLLQRMRKYTNDNYSDEALSVQYENIFNDVINK